MPAYQKKIRLRSKKYRDFIASKNCIMCGPTCNGDVVAHHERKLGPAGMALKASDLCCLPLCHFHHNWRHSPGMYPMWPHDDYAQWYYLARQALQYINEFLRLGNKF